MRGENACLLYTSTNPKYKSKYYNTGYPNDELSVLSVKEQCSYIVDIPVSYTHLQVGRLGCFGFMIINIPGTWFGWWSDEAFALYLIVDTLSLIHI